MIKGNLGEVLSPSEKLLLELGVTQPEDIDLDAIAFHRGVVINYRPLVGCEAQLLGLGDRAIAIVNSHSSRRRQRFSIAHELGHWHYHRGKVLTCRMEIDQSPGYRPNQRERVADGYAADLILPKFLFRPAAYKHGKTTIEVAEDLSDEFDASLTATLIRLVEFGPEPAMLICHTKSGRKWFTPGPDVPERWFPRKELDPESYAMDVLFGNSSKSRRVRIGADAWFDRREAGRYSVLEQSVRIGEHEILSLVILFEDEMLEDES